MGTVVLVLASVFALIPGVDWSRDAVAGYFANPWELESCTITVTETATSYTLPSGGSIAKSQRFIGCLPGTNVPIFQ